MQSPLANSRFSSKVMFSTVKIALVDHNGEPFLISCSLFAYIGNVLIACCSQGCQETRAKGVEISLAIDSTPPPRCYPATMVPVRALDCWLCCGINGEFPSIMAVDARLPVMGCAKCNCRPGLDHSRNFHNPQIIVCNLYARHIGDLPEWLATPPISLTGYLPTTYGYYVAGFAALAVLFYIMMVSWPPYPTPPALRGVFVYRN